MPGTVYRNAVEVTENAEGRNLSTYNRLASCVVSATTITVPPTSYNANSGIVLAQNGKLYCVQYSVSTDKKPFAVTITDNGLEYEQLSLDSIGAPYTWQGVYCALAPNGLIYCVPLQDTRVMTINPDTHEVLAPITGLTSELYKGGALHPNGKIYCAPWVQTSSGHIGVIDTSNNTIDTSITGPTGSYMYHGGVLAPNGKIYCAPSGATNVLIIDPEAGTADWTTITGVSSGYAPGTLAHNGKIYFPPTSSTKVLIVDTSDDTAEETSITGLTGTDKYGNSVLAQDGKIYCCPSDATNILIIDPETDTADTTTISGLSSTSFKHHCMVLAPNGKIYCPPEGTFDKFTVINPGIAKYPIAPLLSPYQNS